MTKSLSLTYNLHSQSTRDATSCTTEMHGLLSQVKSISIFALFVTLTNAYPGYFKILKNRRKTSFLSVVTYSSCSSASSRSRPSKCLFVTWLDM